MIDDLKEKIKNILGKGSKISEDEVQSLMIRVSKRLEWMSDAEGQKYLILKLFCNWSKHIKIDQSNTGLRILAKVNDALVAVNTPSYSKHQTELEISKAIGYVALRREFNEFLKDIDLTPMGSDLWGHFLIHLFQIIKDQPLKFPPLLTIEKDRVKKKIYERVRKNQITPEWSVVSIEITEVDYSKIPESKDSQNLLSVKITFENDKSIVVPMLIDPNSL